jgi:hypothetical protein
VRKAHINHRYFGVNVGASSNNVVIGARGALLGGTGFLGIQDDGTVGFGDLLFADWLRVWTATGTFFLKYDSRATDETNHRLTNVTCWDGQGAVLKTGQALTWAMTDAERAHYTVGQMEVEDFVFTQSGGAIWTGSHVDGIKYRGVSGPYRGVDGQPLNQNTDTINVDKGGPNPYGANGPFPQTS